MEIEEVRVTIGPDGRVTVEVSGVKGKRCLEITRPLEEALGGVVEVRELTSEAYQFGEVESQERDRHEKRHRGY